MEAYEIINRTMKRGEAERLAKMTGKSAELFNSYGRPPRTPENPFGTGNYSPPHHYIEYFMQRLGANREGAVQMHALVNTEIGELLDSSVEEETLTVLSNELLRRATDAVTGLNRDELCHSSTTHLQSLDESLNKLASQIEITRAVIRAEIRLRGVTTDAPKREMARCP